MQTKDSFIFNLGRKIVTSSWFSVEVEIWVSGRTRTRKKGQLLRRTDRPLALWAPLQSFKIRSWEISLFLVLTGRQTRPVWQFVHRSIRKFASSSSPSWTLSELPDIYQILFVLFLMTFESRQSRITVSHLWWCYSNRTDTVQIRILCPHPWHSWSFVGKSTSLGMTC